MRRGEELKIQILEVEMLFSFYYTILEIKLWLSLPRKSHHLESYMFDVKKQFKQLVPILLSSCCTL